MTNNALQYITGTRVAIITNEHGVDILKKKCLSIFFRKKL